MILNKVQRNDLFEDIRKEFEERVQNFYSARDRDKGFILIQNRRGLTEKFPLMTITCVTLNNRSQDFENIYDLTEYLSELKRKARQYNLLIISAP